MKLIMLQGAPGAGKSTWARMQEVRSDERYVRVNKDDLRLELLGRNDPDWKKNEYLVILPERDKRIAAALKAGFNVIVDDTNLAPKHEARLKELARESGAEFQIKRFDTPVDECLRRNALRPDGERVPDDAIRQMAGQMAQSKPTFEKYKVTPGAPWAIICDLDGTLSLHEGVRNVYDGSRCHLDKLNMPVAAVIEAFCYPIDSTCHRCGYEPIDVIYLSGREGKWRTQTEQFLSQYDLPKGALHMRPTGDNRKDWIVKGELFDAHVRGQFNVLFVLDDRDQVVDFWRSIGLTVFQVAPGKF